MRGRILGENRREEWENPRAYRKYNAWDEDEPIYESGNLFLDGEIEEIEKRTGISDGRTVRRRSA